MTREKELAVRLVCKPVVTLLIPRQKACGSDIGIDLDQFPRIGNPRCERGLYIVQQRRVMDRRQFLVPETSCECCQKGELRVRSNYVAPTITMDPRIRENRVQRGGIDRARLQRVNTLYDHVQQHRSLG